MSQTGRISEKFERLDQNRSTKLTTAREAARLTIPGLLPSQGSDQNTPLPVSFSSIAARGVANLASRLVSVTYPLNNIPFFQLEVDPELLAPLLEQVEDPEEIERAIEESMQRYEFASVKAVASSNFRPTLLNVYKHLIVCGDCMLCMEDNFRYKVYRLDKYVVERRGDDSVACLVFKDALKVDTLEEQEKIPAEAKNARPPDRTTFAVSPVEWLYTEVECRRNGSCVIRREFRGVEWEEGAKSVVNYWPLRWSVVDDEEYGRSLCEENIGDLRAMESWAFDLSVLIGKMASGKTGVDPTGITEIEALIASAELDIVPARQQDVFTVEYASTQHVEAVANAVRFQRSELGNLFLLSRSSQRQAERVTATEIRRDAEEIEDALGGVFSSVSADVLVPMIRRILRVLADKGVLPEGLSDTEGSIVDIQVRTGLEALGREVQGNRIETWLDRMAVLPQALQEDPEVRHALKGYSVIRELTLGRGLNPDILMNSREQVAERMQAEQQQAQQAAIQAQGIQSMGTIAENASAQQPPAG